MRMINTENDHSNWSQEKQTRLIKRDSFHNSGRGLMFKLAPTLDRKSSNFADLELQKRQSSERTVNRREDKSTKKNGYVVSPRPKRTAKEKKKSAIYQYMCKNFEKRMERGSKVVVIATPRGDLRNREAMVKNITEKFSFFMDANEQDSSEFEVEKDYQSMIKNFLE